MQDFGWVIAQVGALESTLQIVNTNLTNMSTLLYQFMIYFASFVFGSVASGKTTSIVTTLIILIPPIEFGELFATPEVAMLKNMTPLVLRKRSTIIRRMQFISFCINELICIAHVALTVPSWLEISLMLEGKAYKWWMSLLVDTCLKTWEEFEEMFWKEFLH